MQVNKRISPLFKDAGAAQSALAEIALTPTFLFGYVDEKVRCVTFHRITNEPLQVGQQPVDLVFAPRPTTDFKSVTESLKPIADAIFGKANS